MDPTTAPRRGRSRLADVARLAGVSTSTASKILNDVPTVSARPATRQRVLDAALTLGYHPNVTARALAGMPARALALMVEELTNPIYARLIRGVFEEGRALGYTILVVEGTQGSNDSFVNLVAAGHVDGILVGSARRDNPLPESLVRQNVPHVFVNRAVEGSGRNVTMELASASWLAVERLVDLGHKVIAHIAGPAEVETARMRAAAFTAAARAAGVAAPVVHVPFGEAGGALGAAQQFDARDDITAVFTSSLSQAVGVLHDFRSRGVRVPDDVSLIAYDEMPLAGYLNPPLDTVAMPLEEMGRTAVRALVAQVDGEAPTDIVVPTLPRLVLRGSTIATRKP